MRWSTALVAGLVLAAALLLVACASPPDTPTVEVVTVVVPFLTPTPTPACSPLVPGCAFTLTTQPNAVMVELSGLQPGEQPLFVAWLDMPGVGGARYETGPLPPVGADGRLVHRQFGLQPVAEAEPNVWHLQVIHARGVACIDVTLP